MNKRRLLKLADLLEDDAKYAKGIKFDYLEWGTVTDIQKPASCGTTACAMGLAAVSGAFKRQGLSFQRISCCNEINITLNGKGGAINDAVELFDLTKREAIFLFASSTGLPATTGAKAEIAVAKRIRDFTSGETAV